MYKVSVMVPVYNVEKYLRQCLESIAAQTLKELEVIIVDDGSTDSSPLICDEFAQKYSFVRVIHKINEGYGKACNLGINEAKGEYISIIESDDFIKENDFFETLYNTAKQNDCDLVKSDYYLYWQNPEKIQKMGEVSKFECNKVFDVQRNDKILSLVSSIWSAIYKKSFLDKYNIRFLETKGASYQDISFQFKTLAMAQRLVFVDKPFICYRQDNFSSSVKSKGKVFVICEEYDELEKYLTKHFDIKNPVYVRKLINQYKGYMWNLWRIAPEFRNEFLNKTQETFSLFYKQNKLSDLFFDEIKKDEFELLLNNKEKFFDEFLKKRKQKEKRIKRRNMFSLNIKKNGVRLVLFGKTLQLGEV